MIMQILKTVLPQELKEIDYVSEKRYFVFDTERYTGDLNKKALFRYIEDRTITGYKLFLKPDFLNKVHFGQLISTSRIIFLSIKVMSEQDLHLRTRHLINISYFSINLTEPKLEREGVSLLFHPPS